MIDLYRLAYPIITVTVRGIFRLCGGFRVEGADRVPRAGPVILAANHISYADPPALGAALSRPAWFMAKEPLFRNPILAGMLRFTHSFPVDQERMDRHAIRAAEQLLARGEIVAIFPEGGTSPTGELQRFFPGLGLIALHAGVPVVPVALIGTNRVVPYEQIWPRPARGGVTVRFGPPLDLRAAPASPTRRQHVEAAMDRVREAIRCLLEP